MTEIQSQLIDELRQNDCNVSAALDLVGGCSLQEFDEFLKVKEFQEAYDYCLQVRDDVALKAFMDLVKSGEKAAVIEYQKQQRQREDISEIKRTKREIMRILIENLDTKTKCCKEYCQIFKCTNHMAEDQFKKVVNELGLKTPLERMKEAKGKNDNLLSERFSRGELTEVEMYSSMMERALYDSENAEYPSERSKARADVISINQRLDEINERLRREEESDDQNIFDKLDAVLAGVSAGEIGELKQRVNSHRLELSDVTADS